MNNDRNVDSYREITNFLNNKKVKEHGLSNLYLVKKTDSNGDVSTYYGLNCFTNYGMEKLFSSSYNYPYYIYLGTGKGIVSINDTKLFETIYEGLSYLSGSSKYSNAEAYRYPLYYDRDNGMITCFGSILEYNGTPSVPEPGSYKITEYGFGNDSYWITPDNGYENKLWSHSLVYDESGKQTSFIIRQGDKLEIKVFFCVSYHESMITDAWKNNAYPIITSAQTFMYSKFGGYNGYIDRIFSYGYTGSETYNYYTSASSVVYSAFMNNEVSIINTFSGYTLDNDTSYSALLHLIYYDSYGSEGFRVDMLPKLSVPQEFDNTFSVSSIPTSFDSLQSLISKKLNVSQLSVDNVSLFSFKNGDWSNNIEFINDPDTDYYDSMNTDYSSYGYDKQVPTIYYTSAPDYFSKMYIYQNLNDDVRITALSSDSPSTVYATDKYWDTSSWKLITDKNNIPEELQRCRYWLTDISKSPYRSPIHPIREKKLGLSESLKFEQKPEDFRVISCAHDEGFMRICDNYEYGWYSMDSKVYVPDQNLSFPMCDTVYTVNYNTKTWGKWLVSVPYQKPEIILINMEGVKESGVIPTPIIYSVKDFGHTSTYAYSMETETGTGIFCRSLLTSYANPKNMFIVIDVRSDSPNVYAITGSAWACAMYGTNNIAFSSSSSDKPELKIYNVDSDSVIKTIDLSDKFTNKDFRVVAHGKLVWVYSQNDYGYTWLIDTETETFTIVLENFMGKYGGYSSPSHISFTDKFLVLSPGSSSSLFESNSITLINVDEPTKTLYPLDTTDVYEGYSIANTVFRYINNDTPSLFMSYKRDGSSTTIDSVIMDIGLYYHTGEKHYIRNADYYTMIPYGEYLINPYNGIQIPLWSLMKMRIKGSTTTFNSINGDCKLSNLGTIKCTLSNIGPLKNTITGELQ